MMADLLFEAGYGSARDLMEVSPDQLAMVEGLNDEKAAQIWEAAREYVEHLAEEDAEEARREAIAKDFFSQKIEREDTDREETAVFKPEGEF
jgi:transcription termination factor NusA